MKGLNIFITILVIGFCIAIAIMFHKSTNHLKSSEAVSFETEVQNIYFTDKIFTALRNTEYLNDSLYFDCIARLITVNPPEKKNEFEYVEYLCDLEPPYFFSKRANSDTILIEKDGAILYFIMLEYN